jgi:hypothetical protein
MASLQMRASSTFSVALADLAYQVRHAAPSSAGTEQNPWISHTTLVVSSEFLPGHSQLFKGLIFEVFEMLKDCWQIFLQLTIFLAPIQTAFIHFKTTLPTHEIRANRTQFDFICDNYILVQM